MILLYRVFTTLLYPFLFLIIFLRKFLNKEHSIRYKEKIFPSFFNVKRNSVSKLIWFHAASLGELKSIIPIIKKLNRDNNNLEFLITTITLSSSNLAIEELKKFTNASHRFFPFDVNFLMEKFFYLWKPDIIMLVDSEIWPNLIFNAKKFKVPIGLINARITSKTFKKWMMFPKTAKKIFSLFDLCLTSNLETKNNLLALNAKNIFFCGNIKLISDINQNDITNINKSILKKNRFWFAASTHNGEELLCLKTHSLIKKKYKNIITIIAPRHIDRVKKIQKLCEYFKYNSQILNNGDLISQDKEIIIINSYGILQDYFKYAKSVFIGKSIIKNLINVGGQNPIDAAKLGCKIYHGPYVYNFKEIYKILEDNKISKKIENYIQLSENLINDLKSRDKQKNMVSNLINELGHKILSATIDKINNFIK